MPPRLNLPTVFTADQTFLSFVRKRHHSHHDPYLTPSLSSLTPKHGSTLSAMGPAGPSSAAVEEDTTSVLSLFKEDYVAVKEKIKVMDYKQVWKRASQRHMYKWYAILIIAGTLTVLITVKHHAVVDFCRPITEKIRSWPAGWLIPIAVLIIVSFPPLVGHEIIGILCGLVWGLWVGFAILAAGTFLGEIATWVAFKRCCQIRAAKFEKKNRLYAALTQLIREKSFMFVLILRFSAVPGHITTAVSASAGANFWSYLLAAFLTLPKQWTIVYLGKAFGTTNRTNTIISVLTTVFTILATVIAAVYIYYQMRLVMRRWALASPVHVESSTTSMILSECADEKGQNGLYTRRRWMAFNDSNEYVNGCEGRTLTRSWSMPEHMREEELKEWVRSLENESSAEYAPSASTQLNAEAEDDSASASNIKINIQMELDSILPTPSPPVTARLPNPSSGITKTSGLGAPQSVIGDSNFPSPSPSLLELNLPSAYPPTLPSRQSSFTRRIPSDSSLYFDATVPGASYPQRVGGREIADEADAYAIAHGARRPELQRMRGDSRAALLGRPVDDAALHQCGSSWRREYSHSRGDSSAAVLGGPVDDGLRTEVFGDGNDVRSYEGEGSAILKEDQEKHRAGDENV
ncbi:hypothetical protein I312_101877 [Cryptococcus bacillisporus CA1280]|uniref:uncharacterized protein n=1 Tax=Cryptococcus bacillisporus CA1280 TaxID=1296109 RepID=UPI0033672303